MGAVNLPDTHTTSSHLALAPSGGALLPDGSAGSANLSRRVSSIANTSFRGDRPRLRGGLGAVAICLVCPLLAVVLAEVLKTYSLSWSITLGAAIGLVLATSLVIARYDLAVSIGFLLSGVVLVEPAPSDVLFGIIIVVALVTGRFRFPLIPRSAIAVVAALLVVNVISASNVESWGAAARFFVITLYLCVFSLWIASYVNGPDKARRVIRAYLAAAVFSAAIGSLALFVPFPGHTTLTLAGERAKALFKDPNVYGPFLIPINLILIEEIFRPRLLRLRRSFKLICFMILTVGILFSYSRAAWLNFSIALIILVGVSALGRLDRKTISLVIVLVLGALAIVGAIYLTGSLSFLKERAQLQSYDTARFAAQNLGVSVGMSHLFGIGPGQFNVISENATFSLYIRALAEQGLPGLFVMAGLALLTLGFALLNVIRGRDTYGISAAALLAAWAGLLANSFVVDTVHWRHLWLVAGLIWAGAARRTSAAPLQPPPERLRPAVVRPPPGLPPPGNGNGASGEKPEPERGPSEPRGVPVAARL